MMLTGKPPDSSSCGIVCKRPNLRGGVQGTARYACCVRGVFADDTRGRNAMTHNSTEGFEFDLGFDNDSYDPLEDLGPDDETTDRKSVV